jgi:hypothetical protein
MSILNDLNGLFQRRLIPDSQATSDVITRLADFIFLLQNRICQATIAKTFLEKQQEQLV